jgi:hypothetical protein
LRKEKERKRFLKLLEENVKIFNGKLNQSKSGNVLNNLEKRFERQTRWKKHENLNFDPLFKEEALIL